MKKYGKLEKFLLSQLKSSKYQEIKKTFFVTSTKDILVKLSKAESLWIDKCLKQKLRKVSSQSKMAAILLFFILQIANKHLKSNISA